MIVWGEQEQSSGFQLALDADQRAQSQLQNAQCAEGASESFRMSGLFGLIPQSSVEPIALTCTSTLRIIATRGLRQMGFANTAPMQARPASR
jgi:hypothetical protein